MAGLFVRKGDLVQVISGKDRGITGKVIEVFPESDRVIVEGVNRIKKHTAQSQNERGASSGGIVTQEAAIHVSNVMVIDSDGNPTRIGYRVDDCAAALASMIAAGATPIDQAPRPGSRGTTVAFVHPKGSFGTLIELVQE